jgi:hypothetical protein
MVTSEGSAGENRNSMYFSSSYSGFNHDPWLAYLALSLAESLLKSAAVRP